MLRTSGVFAPVNKKSVEGWHIIENDLSMQTFENPQALASWLRDQQINLDAWGQGAAKSVEDLWREVQNAESALYAEAPLRRVRVVELVVQNGDRQLIEAAQTFASGQVRRRNQSPSEKMLPTEDPFSAARRCLAEELGVEPKTAVTFPPQDVKERQEFVESTSYPGLLTQFTFYRVVAQVPALPPSDFTTHNSAHAHGDPVVAHHWRWQTHTDR
jgi:hypothetical protein